MFPYRYARGDVLGALRKRLLMPQTGKAKQCFFCSGVAGTRSDLLTSTCHPWRLLLIANDVVGHLLVGDPRV